MTLWTHDVYVRSKTEEQARFRCTSPMFRHNPCQDNYRAIPHGQDTRKYFYTPHQNLFETQEQGHQHCWAVLALCPLKAYA